MDRVTQWSVLVPDETEADRADKAPTERLLEVLLAGGARGDLAAPLEAAAGAGTGGDVDSLRRQHALALRIHDEMADHRRRQAELSALNETARDLNEIRDLDKILTVIVSRARTLLGADMSYLSLMDEARGVSYVKVTDGSLTPDFKKLRLPLGTGLLGLVAQEGEPYFTEDYRTDARFFHRRYIDDAVDGEQVRAILGVPLKVGGKVIGALLATHRRVRRFPASEVALLSAFAAHAAIALENARLFDEVRSALDAVDAANARLRAQNEAVERAARAQDELIAVLADSRDVADVAAVLSPALGGVLGIYDEDEQLLAGSPSVMTPEVRARVAAAPGIGRCVLVGQRTWAVRAVAAEQHLGTLVLAHDRPLSPGEQRTLERGALATALVLLFRQVDLEAERKVRGELLTDMLARGNLDPARLREVARLQGVDLDTGLAVAVARPADPQLSQSQAVRGVAALAADLEGLGAVHQDALVVLASLPPAELGEQVARRFPGATVGVAPCPGGAAGVWDAWRDASETLRALLALGRSGEVCDAAGLGLARLLLGHNGRAELDGFTRSTLGPLLAYDERRGTDLLATLTAWFAAEGSVRETADRMHVHPNTVAQRLDRIGRVLGPAWRAPGRRLDLQVAVLLHQLGTQV
ncbi:GAF domain-containing protein [Pimelobacter sp. 30-1]|uniref:helix-turn-helix domain-containing protein n=1 Tax=Pimelobacter sp. 30-1 TaxID=2004991 RepID=UPI001C0445B5|nr:GAF domain-containing protein [Pimelobacter sp. 30-1]